MLRLRSTAARAALCMTTLAHAQDENASWTFDTYTPGVCSPNGGQHGGCPAGDLVRIHVVTVAHGLVRPWHLTFLPGGADFLVTELPGDLRIVRGGKLDPKPIPGWPADALRARSMNSVVLHPDFERNRLLYISYVKQRDGGDTTIALARGRFDGSELERRRGRFRRRRVGHGCDRRPRRGRARRDVLLDGRRSRRRQRHR